MDDLTDQQKEKIIATLRERGAEGSCPRCGNGQFALAGGYFNPPIQTVLGGLVLGGPTIPCAVVVCGKCGWVAQHALGVLGLLPEQPGEKPGGEK
jgi:ribosomal protein S27AE